MSDQSSASSVASGQRLWSIDEYVVVADLYLRRGRSSGVHDKEVEELAALTGRSVASISRRLGNFAGTAKPGTGLKPVEGEALREFELMRADDAVRQARVSAARARLEQGRPRPVSSTVLVPTENLRVEGFPVISAAASRDSRRREALLVRAFMGWIASGAISSALIRVGGTRLRVDLYHQPSNVLIEAKADVTRDSVRLALGQLYDYRRYFDPPPALAVLAPAPLSVDLADLLDGLGVGAIWPVGADFVDSESGNLIARLRA